MEPQILIESVNASGTFMAFAEQTDKTVYFYIQPHPALESQFNMRACWVRNLQPAPEMPDTAAMEQGEAPMMPAPYCAHPQGEAPLKEEATEIEVIWFPSEEGAALLLDGEPVAIISGWSLHTDPPVSYSRACSRAWGLNFPLLEDNDLLLHVEEAQRFAASWESDESPWHATQNYILGAYESVYGRHKQYFAIDGGKWPPMAVASFEYEDQFIFLTLGVSQRPMPWVDYLYDDAVTGYRRMELAVAVHRSLGEDTAMKLAEGISGLAGMPWRKVSWLGEGHTIASNAVSPPYESLILSSALYNGPELPPLEMNGDKVNIYWAQPITKEEREQAHSKPNGGYDLIEQLIAQDVNHVVMPGRKS
ncbi:suppressor of fused domain protein [Chitinophagaceae bacterium MMS25-I14]